MPLQAIMVTSLSKIIGLFCLLLVLLPSGVLGFYDVVEVATGKAMSQTVLSMQRQDSGMADLALISVAKDGSRKIELYVAADNYQAPKIERPLAEDVIFVDSGRYGNTDALLLFSARQARIININTGVESPVIEFSSIYNSPLYDSVPQINVFKDLNNDGLDDFLIPTFDGYLVSVQLSSGEFSDPQLIPARPLMDMSYNNHPWYQAANLFLVDMNLDGKADICFWKKGDFIVYPQLDDGGFDTSPVTVRSQVSFDLDGIDGISVRMQDEDQSDRLTTVLHELRDLDGDGITDILTQAIRSKGVFNKKTTVAFHKGFAADNGFVRFDPTASSVIQSKGFQYEMRSRDLNNNGEVDILISSVEIGVTKIIGALLTNSVKIDLGFYEMKQGTYPKTADHVRKITAKFSLSTGEFWYPFVRVVDANGDGLDDLLVQRGDDQVLVFVGDADKLFNKTPIKISAPMPKDPDFVSISRLNGDEIEDVVLKIPPDISDSNGSHRIILLLSNHGGALRPN